MKPLHILYAYTTFYALTWAFVPIVVLFQTSRGLTFTEIGMLTGWYYALFFLYELPTGVIADKLGRRNTIVMGCLFQLAAILLQLNSFTFIAFFISETIYALSRSLMSGADSAFLYDSLSLKDQQTKYRTIESKRHAIDLGSHTFSGLIIAVLVIFGLQYVYYFSAICAVLATIFALKLVEPASKHFHEHSVAAYIRHLKDSIIEVVTNKKLLWLMLVSGFIFILLRASLISLIQPLIIALEMPTFTFGLLDAALSLGAAMVALKAEAIEKKLGLQKTLLLMPLIMFISFLGMSITSNAWATAFYLLIMIVWAIKHPLFLEAFNKLIQSSHQRATMLSVDSLVSRVLFAFFAVGLGYAIDTFGVQNAMLLMAACSLMGILLLAVTGRKIV